MSKMTARLYTKVAVVTGGAGGIGRAACRAFAREGARVVVGDLDSEAAQAVAESIRSEEGEALAWSVDVRSAASVEALVAKVEEHYGRLDVMFNNAGIFDARDGSIVSTSEKIWDQVLSVNLKGVYLGCKYGIPAMLRGGGGSIINMGSFVALMGAAVSQSAYTASKGGVVALTREIAVEFARQGIRANSLCPGPVNTALVAELFRDERARQRRLLHIPMGRLAESEEVAEAAVFLASDESSFVTGTELLVDGGIRAAYVTPE